MNCSSGMRAYVALPLILLCLCLVGFACSKSSPLPERVQTEDEKKAEDGRNALAAKKAAYTTIPSKEQLAKEPYRDKKLVVYRFDSTKKEDPWTQNDFGTNSFGSSIATEARNKLDFKLAKSADEVGLIALLPECKSIAAGQYGSVANAYKERCELILVDPEISAVVFRKTFEGELEIYKSVGKNESSVTAKVDGMKIVDFLDQIPNNPRPSPQKTGK